MWIFDCSFQGEWEIRNIRKKDETEAFSFLLS